MDFYDTLRYKKIGKDRIDELSILFLCSIIYVSHTYLDMIGSNVSHCSTTFQWSPDSRYFMTGLYIIFISE